jgi:lipid-binding SYLF domain-containing protein
MLRILRLIALTATLALVAAGARADSKTEARLDSSLRVFQQFSNLSEQSIPTWLLERAYGIVVVPDVIKGAFIVGGRGGKGVMAVRQPDGSWSNPVFVTLAGVNVGFQWGVQATDVILVLLSRQSVEGIAGGKVTLGADTSVAAGPMGRSAAATTDATLKAQVLSYSRAEGLFVGVALDGSVISVDDRANASAYGVSDILASQILEGRVGTPSPKAIEFTQALAAATSGSAGAAATPASAPAGPAAPGSVTSAPAAPAEPATTYPMEDPNPGAPPPQ